MGSRSRDKLTGTSQADPGFVRVVEGFAKDRRISYSNGKGFGSGALALAQAL
jgi:hypothetical protein